jgi:hypothetical protein
MLSTLLLLVPAAALAYQPPGGAAQPAAGPIPPRIETFLRESEELRRGTIMRLEQQLRTLRAQPSSPDARQKVAKLTEDLRTLQSRKEPIVPTLKYPPAVGAIGRLPRLSAHVEQVLAGGKMLVRCDFSLKVRAVQNFRPRYETVFQPVTFLVDGVPAGEAHEGADLPLAQVFEITGTHSYRLTTGQARTVMVLRPFDMKQVEPYFQAVSGRR